MIKQILVTIISFLIIDIIWIQLVVNKQYESNLPDELLAAQPNVISAVVFYLIFCLSLWFLIISKHADSISDTLVRAFVFGIATYATYSLTNLAVLNGWSLQIAIADTLWGGVLAVLVTLVVIWIG
jgi:uncharacterized membrane protein